MRAKLISEAIKHLTPKSDEELLKVIEREPILDQIKLLDKHDVLRKKLLPFSNKTKQQIREAVKNIKGYYEPSLYSQLLSVFQLNTRYLDWLIIELRNKLIKEAKTISPKQIEDELEMAIEYKRWEWPSHEYEFPPVIDILLKRARENNINITNENILVYMYENHIDFLPYIKKLPSDDFKIVKKDNKFIINFYEWSDFAQYFKENREIGQEAIEKILSGEGSEYFIGYREDTEFPSEFPSFSTNFLVKIRTIFSELKQLLIKQYPEIKEFDDEFLELWRYIENLENNDKLDSRIRQAILRATNETMEVADEDQAYNELKEAIIEFFELENVKYQNQTYKATISEEGAKKLIILLFDKDIIEGIDYTPPYYGWQGDIEKHPDVFIDALLNQL